MEFHQRLIQLRKEKNIDRKQLAKLLNVSYATISKYETGVRMPDSDSMKKIADLFNVSIDYLLGKSDIPTSAESVIATTLENSKLAVMWFNVSKRPELQQLLAEVEDMPKEKIEQMILVIKALKKSPGNVDN
jgi:transcriptional regulator with XRE-family HTH domain